MRADIDLNFLPLHRIAGKDWPSLPGLMMAAPPRRVARGREGDQLFIYLALSGNTPFSSDEYTKIIAQMTGCFYDTSGSLTAALRTTADTLNQTLLNRNLGTTGQGHYIVGRLILGVKRSSQLLVVQSGPTHIFCVGKENVRHLHDPALSGRGLGFSQTTTLYYSQLDLEPGDQLVICAQIPDGWDAALMSERGITSLEALHRKLKSIPSENINAAIIQVQAGKGTMNLLKAEGQFPAKTQPETPAANQAPAPNGIPNREALFTQEQPGRSAPETRSEPVATSPAKAADPMDPVPAYQEETPARATPGHFSQLLRGSGQQEKAEVESQPDPGLDGSAGVTPEFREMAQSQLFDSNHIHDLPEIKRPLSPRRIAFMKTLLNGMQAVRTFGKSSGTGFQTLLKRILPGDENAPVMQGSTMAFIAVIVPLMVVVIASTVYFRFGHSAQYEENYKLAINEAVGAIGQSDSAIVRRAWESTIYYLDRAESFQKTQDSSALRQQAQGALDAMDQIIRLEFRPAIINGLARSIQVGRMSASDTDLYMLNTPQGNVIRAFMTSQGYEVDRDFVCGPGTYASIQEKKENEVNQVTFEVGNILDLVALPRINDFGASLVAMDATGTLLFCNPRAAPRAWKLEEPDIRWKGLAGFSISDQDSTLYILDPAGNAVWEFGLEEKNLYSGTPDLFFSGDYVPKNMNQAVDIAISRTDIYLLFDDGHVTHCTPGLMDADGTTIIPIRCNDPETMTDTRSGHQSGPVLTDAAFTEFTFIASSDPSLYILAPATAAIYRFSPRPETLFLQNQFRAAVEQEKTLFTAPITAMAISPNRHIFLSSGSQIYFALDVP